MSENITEIRGSIHLKFEIIVPVATNLVPRNGLDVIEADVKERAKRFIQEKLPEAKIVKVVTGHIYFHNNSDD